MQIYGDKAQRYRDQIQEELRSRGRRFGAGMAESETRAFLRNFAVPTLFREDPRYFRADRHHRFGYRLGYALSRLAVARSDAGNNTVNVAEIASNCGAAALARKYDTSLALPRLDSNAHMLKSIGVNFAFDGISNIFREFLSRGEAHH
jgi:hypothetical protein